MGLLIYALLVSLVEGWIDSLMDDLKIDVHGMNISYFYVNIIPIPMPPTISRSVGDGIPPGPHSPGHAQIV